MKKTNAKKKLLPAIGMLAISAAMLSSATFAWFTMNKHVQVTGMQMKTTVSGNLLISADNVEAHYTNDVLTQSRYVLLEPTSTVKATDGSFFYTLDAAADGHKIHETSSNAYVQYNENSDAITGIDKITTYTSGTSTDRFASSGAAKEKMDTAFNSAYGISGAGVDASSTYTNAYGYVDYTFFLKATADTANQQIRMTRCNLVRNYQGTGDASAVDHVLDDTNKSWRIAVFAESITDKGDGTYNQEVTGTSDSPITILKPNGAANFTTDKAVSSTTALDTVTNKDQAAVIGTVTSVGESQYYKVVIRVWLEGEDNKCFSENYALMKELYKLDLAFELGKGTAVNKIDSTLTAYTPS